MLSAWCDCGGPVWRRFHFAKPQVFRNSLSNLVGSKVMCPLSLQYMLTSGTVCCGGHQVMWHDPWHSKYLAPQVHFVTRCDAWLGSGVQPGPCGLAVSPLWFKIVLGFMSVLAVSPLATTAPFVDILRQSPCHHVIVSIRCWHVLPWIVCTKCEWIAVEICWYIKQCPSPWILTRLCTFQESKLDVYILYGCYGNCSLMNPIRAPCCTVYSMCGTGEAIHCCPEYASHTTAITTLC